METITINWNGPFKIENLTNHDYGSEFGIYAVYRVWGETKKLIYIGKTERDFITRLNEHQKVWLCDLRGELKIHLGKLEFEDNKKYSSGKLDHVESLLICVLALDHDLYNDRKKSIYTGRDKLKIINLGRRGLIQDEISTDELDWE